MAAEEYEALSEADDPDVAFLSGSDDVEIRPGRSKKSLQKPRRGSKRASHNAGSARAGSPVIWIVLLCLLLGGLVITLIVIMYHRTGDLTKITSLHEEFQEDSAHPDSAALPNHVQSHSNIISPSKSLTHGIAKNGSQCVWHAKRLPDTLAPRLYDLNLHIDLTVENYTGIVKIDFDVLIPTTMIILHGKNLSIGSAELKRFEAAGPADKGEGIPIKRIEICRELDLIEISVGSTLFEKFRYNLALRFSAKLGQSTGGLYVSHYRDVNGQKRALAATQFEPTYARSAFPCFDEPQWKAVFRVKILHDKDLTAVSNMPRERTSVSRVDPNFLETAFKDTPVMSTYLLAVLVSDFAVVQGQREPISVDLHVSQNKISQTQFALDVAAKVTEFFSEFFGISYPLPKLDLAAIPDFAAGAMENWGLITFREKALLYDPQESGLNQMEYVATVVAHEVAHQWFGNLVTMAWWEQLWLNEGFAAFMEYLGVNFTNPELLVMQKHLVSDVQEALSLDSLLSTHPVVAAVEDPAEIVARFDDISYKKGSSILWMLFESLGQDVFRRGVTQYLKSHMYKNAETKALWEALNDAWQNTTDGRNFGLTVEKIANSWTIQPGYPLLTASRTADGVHITQTRLVPFGENITFSPKWYVPIALVTSLGGQEDKSWMAETTLDLKIPEMQRPVWYRLKQTGFYRVTYDGANWKAISSALMRDHTKGFTPEDRSTLVDDALSLSKLGLLNVTFALDVVSYLKNEKHYLPWKSASPLLKGLESLLYGTSSFRKFRTWRKELVRPVFEQLDCKNSNRSDIAMRRLCIQIFDEACYVGVDGCINLALEIFAQLRRSNTSVPVDIRKYVYQTVARRGTEEDWDFLWKRYLTTTVASEKDVILRALGSTENMALITQFLRDSLDDSLVRQSDTTTAVAALANNYVARDLVWKTIRQNWNLIMKRHGSDSAVANFLYCLDWMSTPEDLQDIKEFFEHPGRSLGAGLLAYKEIQEIIGLHWKFLKLYGNDITNWLVARGL
ncbi:endoplasmic reticulum aminopeptidase 1-like [Paramacrobiotus metropolitanus]|uniref:endoplasmic reticulum aminopeptidase 1-like n=1 Tax=Paramacrobiotus metropolitanus TaxID=2943436 RepID=UPI002446331A|nr:endoplasmic reticulum aminopeptidase 1-like [Paramacrobiotus metropolitanus]